MRDGVKETISGALSKGHGPDASRGSVRRQDPTPERRSAPFSIPIFSLVRFFVLRKLQPVMANRKLGCLSIFLFVALCASMFMNFVLAITAFRRLSGGTSEEERAPYFRETIVQQGKKGSNDKIALIALRGLISS